MRRQPLDNRYSRFTSAVMRGPIGCRRHVVGGLQQVRSFQLICCPFSQQPQRHLVPDRSVAALGVVSQGMHRSCM